MKRDDEEGLTYTADQVSQGEVILRTPLRKAIFIGARLVRDCRHRARLRRAQLISLSDEAAA